MEKERMRAKKPTNEEVWEQLQAMKEVLRRVFGSVNNAAKGIGWPQKTLDRLLNVSQGDLSEAVRRNVSALLVDIIRTVDVIPVTDDEEGSIERPTIPPDIVDTMLGFSLREALTEKMDREGVPGEQNGSTNEVEPNALGNAGIIFIDADTGKEFFVVEFPPYLRVINPYEVVLRPRSLASSPKPDVNDFEEQSVE